MNIPFIDLKKQNDTVREEILKSIEHIIDASSFILGKSVSDFENDFAAVHNSRYCIGLSSGTDGNHLALWSLGIKAGDEVIIPANTFIATAWGAVLCGAKPVFADCEKDSYNLDLHDVEKKISPKTKAIVAVHLYGQSADLDRLKEISDRHGIYLLEDAAQSHLAEYKGKKIGSHGVSASFSFYPGKNLGALGEGGAVTTNDQEIAEKIRMMRDHGCKQKYHHETYGHNYRMEGIQGAVLGIKLKRLQSWTDKRREAADKYRELLSNTGDIELPKEMDYAKHVYHLFVIKTSKRDGLQEYLKENSIATGLHYPVPLHLQKCFANLGYKKGDFPVTEDLADKCLSLPIFPELTDNQIEYICEKIKKFFE
ncbi:MAG: dTDP-3-amino-3,4,6-trideoxy-alpha-D-glucose transaminase [Ignavibacteria bacterium]|nr:dTDP-3-amino-3,4,6-trideoxy-alpha-D-glucose transaminase [Ignavibacteria bacterium]